MIASLFIFLFFLFACFYKINKQKGSIKEVLEHMGMQMFKGCKYQPMMKISVITDISVLRFYGYIGGYFGKKYR